MLFFTDEKIKRRLDEIKATIHREVIDIPCFEFIEGNPPPSERRSWFFAIPASGQPQHRHIKHLRQCQQRLDPVTVHQREVMFKPFAQNRVQHL